MISGPRPAPALSAGSILSDKILVCGSVTEFTPDFHLKSALFPVEPYLKNSEAVSLKFSKKEVRFLASCARVLIHCKRINPNKIRCFIIGCCYFSKYIGY